MRVVQYLNQFFGQIGGESYASMAPQVIPKAIGPAQVAQKLLGEEGELIATIVVGDNWINERLAERTQEVATVIENLNPDIVLLGPAFGAGRYGVAVGALAEALLKRHRIAIGAMAAENPGQDIYRRSAYLVDSGLSPKTMAQVIGHMVELGLALYRKERIESADAWHYFAQGRRVPYHHAQIGADRAVAALVARLTGQTYQTEVRREATSTVTPAPRLRTLDDATIVMISDGGIVPCGNPDHIEASMATRYGVYDTTISCLEPNHGGYDNQFARDNPYRVVPLDVLSQFQQEGLIGALFPFWYSTSGNATSVAHAQAFGEKICQDLRRIRNPAVLLTST